jgi:hypothetical protein
MCCMESKRQASGLVATPSVPPHSVTTRVLSTGPVSNKRPRPVSATEPLHHLRIMERVLRREVHGECAGDNPVESCGRNRDAAMSDQDSSLA